MDRALMRYQGETDPCISSRPKSKGQSLVQKQEPLTPKQQQLVTDNISLIYHVANPLRRKGLPLDVFDDLVGYLYHRLCVCAANWDPARGNTIATYVVHCLKGEIKNFFRDKSWTSGVRPPRRLRETTFARIVDGDGENPSEAEAQGDNPVTIRSCAQPVSLDALVGRDGEEGDYRVDILAAPDDTEAEVMEKVGVPAFIQEIMNALTLEDQEILTMLMDRSSMTEVQATYQISRPVAIEVCDLVRTRVQRIYFAVLDGETLSTPEPNHILNEAIRRRFDPPAEGYVEVYRRAMAHQAEAAGYAA
jgi:DNA-directed RNA polymerase specialized sigma subunit